MVTDAGWTAGKAVKEAGWYWWKYKGMLSIVELRAWPNGKKLYAKGGVTVPINALELDGEFLGPITPDDRQQGKVEGIGECKDLVDSFAEAYLLASMVAHSLSPEIHKCIAEFVSSVGGEIAKLAQQAQEGGVGDADTHVIS